MTLGKGGEVGVRRGVGGCISWSLSFPVLITSLEATSPGNENSADYREAGGSEGAGLG